MRYGLQAARASLAGWALASAMAQAQPIDFLGSGGGSYRVPIVSQKAAKFKATQVQQYDFSCGSAAVATLLTFHYGQPTSETDAFAEMYAHGDVQKIRKEGFSLLDIKRFLSARGFEADGFELPLEKLVESRVPAIVLITESGYNHFVVVKGLRAGRVLVGDPSSGTRVMTRARFDAVWQSRVLFVIHNRQDLASFNTETDWQYTPAAPLASGLPPDSLVNIVIPRLGPGEL